MATNSEGTNLQLPRKIMGILEITYYVIHLYNFSMLAKIKANSTIILIRGVEFGFGNTSRHNIII